MKKDNCIFCKIAAGDIPANVIYENDDFKVFMDASPATKGHCLIVTKDHYDNLYDLPESLATGVFPLAKKIMALEKEKLGCEGFNVVQNNGTIAGQTVYHFHVHLIPRYQGDGQTILWKPQTPAKGELENTLAEILA